MVLQVHSNYNLRNDTGKPSGIFIKDITQKMIDGNKKYSRMIAKVKDVKRKKWEPKKKVQFQNVEVVKTNVQDKKLELPPTKQVVVPVVQIV